MIAANTKQQSFKSCRNQSSASAPAIHSAFSAEAAQ